MAKRTTKGKTKEESELLKALRFVSVAQTDVGTAPETHCAIANNYVMAFNGVIAAGYPCAEEMFCFPHTKRLIDALTKTKGALSLALLPTSQLSVKDGERFKALVPTVDYQVMTYVEPDPKNWPLNDAFKFAGDEASIYTTDGAQTVVGASLMTQDYSIIGTNGAALIEVAHGLPTPPGLILPNKFFKILAGIDIPIAGFGFTPGASFTVWFDNNAWLRTQLYDARWPNITDLLLRFGSADMQPFPGAFFEGLEAVASFSPDGRITAADNYLMSHGDETQGATFYVPGMEAPLSFNVRHIAPLKDVAAAVDFGVKSGSNVIIWSGMVKDLQARGLVVKYS